MSYMEDALFKNFMHEFLLSTEILQEVYTRFTGQIRMGLKADTNKNAETKCYPTYVQDMPDGEELGRYLAIDLGGSKFRILMVHLKGRQDAEVDTEMYPIPGDVMRGTGRKLFDHIAKCLADFVCSRKMAEEELQLGFTFSFPCNQYGLAKATLVRWTKGFNCSDVVDKDVGQLLQDAIKRRGDMKIRVVAIVNDTTSTLVSCAHRTSGCRIGMIVGTGTNVCYLERTENIGVLDAAYKKKSHMIINVEWGAFGDKGSLDFIRSEYDQLIDKNSLNKGAQLFEKMISGMYLGELVRLILLRAAKENLIFNTCSLRSRIILILTNNVDLIETQHIADIESEAPSEIKRTRQLLQLLFCLKTPSDEDCFKMKYVCECVSRRSGQLVGVALSGLINKMGEPKVVVGVDGSVYRFHPRYDSYMREAMELFIDSSIAFDLTLSYDSSGRGAAVVAALVDKE